MTNEKAYNKFRNGISDEVKIEITKRAIMDIWGVDHDFAESVSFMVALEVNKLNEKDSKDFVKPLAHLFDVIKEI